MPQMLLPIFTREVTLINQLIGFAKRDGRVYYFNGQMPIFVHDERDLDSFKMFMAQLFVTGSATQSEINNAFGLNPINMKHWPKVIFREQEIKLHNGEVVRMMLAEKRTKLSKKVKVREIRRLTKSGHQTAIITTDFIPDTIVIAATMFARWSQENFFKYMREHFGIDRLIEYGTTSVDETVKVVHPAYRDIESRIRSVSQKLGRKVSEFGRITLELESKNITEEDEEMRKYVKEKSQEVIELYENEIAGLKEQRKQIEKNIVMGELPECEEYSNLTNEKKHIVDTIKMIDYRAETAMATMIQPKLSQRKATRVLLRQIFSTEVDLEPDTKNKILYVSLHSLSNEKSNKIAINLCKQLNETATVFPGTVRWLFYKLVSS